MDIQRRLTPVNFTRGGNQKKGICIHTQVGNLDGTDAWFHNSSSGVSAHYGIDLDGSRVFQWVEENDQAYAQGIVSKPTFRLVLDNPGINPNTYLISIECADNRDPSGADRSQQYPKIIELVRDICARNNISIDRDHICGHKEIRSTKTCPGNLDIDYIVREAAKSSTQTIVLQIEEYKQLKIERDLYVTFKDNGFPSIDDVKKQISERDQTISDLRRQVGEARDAESKAKNDAFQYKNRYDKLIEEQVYILDPVGTIDLQKDEISVNNEIKRLLKVEDDKEKLQRDYDEKLKNQADNFQKTIDNLKRQIESLQKDVDEWKEKALTQPSPIVTPDQVEGIIDRVWNFISRIWR